MRRYLREQSAREILASTFEIYRHHVILLFLIHLLPTFPFNVWSAYLQETQGEVFNLGYYFALVVEMLPSLAIAVAVSDICLGNPPSALRSYARVLGRRFGRIALTYLLFMAGLLIALLLLVVPAFVYYAWFMFCLIVVVLEGRWGREAFARSKALGAGCYGRNLGLIAVLVLMLIVIMMVGLGLYEGIAVAFPALSGAWPSSIFMAVISSLVTPVVYVGAVLLYYDMRVRKEAYDNTALTEDLMR